MHSIRCHNRSRFAVVFQICLVLWGLLAGGCQRHNGQSVTIQNTIVELRAIAKSWDSIGSDEAHSYLAPAFHAAAQHLEKDGDRALPLMVAANFHYSPDLHVYGVHWVYAFSYLDVESCVRGYYLRLDHEPDIEVYPTDLGGRQVPNTAWMTSAGAVIQSESERLTLPDRIKGGEMIVASRVLDRKNVYVGLILINGRKTPPVRAFFRDVTGGQNEKSVFHNSR